MPLHLSDKLGHNVFKEICDKACHIISILLLYCYKIYFPESEYITLTLVLIGIYNL